MLSNGGEEKNGEAINLHTLVIITSIKVDKIKKRAH